MDMMNPSVMVSRLDLVVLELTVAGIDFRRLPYGFWNIGVFIEQRGVWGHRRWAQPTRARLGAQVPPGGLCPPRVPLNRLFAL